MGLRATKIENGEYYGESMIEVLLMWRTDKKLPELAYESCFKRQGLVHYMQKVKNICFR